MSQRRHVPRSIEADVVLASRRRCCLCVFLEDRDMVRKGQIAHLNRDSSDRRFTNLVYLCLEHHDEYDGRTSQSKGYLADELRAYRDRLYAQNDPHGKWRAQADARLAQPVKSSLLEPLSEYETVRRNFPEELDFTTAPWRFPLWQVANEPEFFAYKAGNRFDGVCLIERIDIPDGRIVVACIQFAGNPGQSITNCVEELCFQVCERFEIPADRLVWLEHYDYDEDGEWSMVTFDRIPPHGPFADPKWVDMTPELWRDLRLKPRKKLRSRRNDFDSKLTKLFPWPTEGLI
jgi:hypothetical protein